MPKKKEVLVWADSPTTFTGFGVVNKNILKYLQKTDEYNFSILGINFFCDFYDSNEFPYQIMPSRLLDPKDPYGSKMLLKSLAQKKYNILLIINDIYVTQNIAQAIQEYRDTHNTELKIIYYYPVDCRVRPDATAMIKLADIPITYTDFGKVETLKVLASVEKKLKVIYHGTDTEVFRPVSADQRTAARLKYFNVKDPDTKIILNVNRNSVRKDLPRTILAFDKYRKSYNRNSILYLHTVAKDQGIDLEAACGHLDLKVGRDVIFPANYNAVQAFPDDILNNIYNASDLLITTTLGEGWGLSITEGMAAGCRILAPDNTSLSEILKPSRGFLYQCDELNYVDNTGYRPVATIDTIVKAMYTALNTDCTEMKKNARKFVEKYSWQNISKQWNEVFSQPLPPKKIEVESI